MKSIRICFTDFWYQFDYFDNFIIRKLKLRFDIEIDEVDPELIIYGNYGSRFLHYTKAIKVCFISENIRPSFLECDYSLSFDYSTYENKNLRFPLYVMYGMSPSMLMPKDPQNILANKSGFCNMVVSNGTAKERIEFFNLLNKFKKVDSGGKILNNIGGPVKDKLTFIKDYRFSIAFENSSFPGYTTEKIIEPMKVNSIPIYWGSTRVADEFNEKSFINVHAFNSLKEAAKHVIEIENNLELLNNMLEQPWFKNNIVPDYFKDELFNNFFENIMDCKKKQTSYYYNKRYLVALSQVVRKKITAKIFKKSYCHLQ